MLRLFRVPELHLERIRILSGRRCEFLAAILLIALSPALAMAQQTVRPAQRLLIFDFQNVDVAGPEIAELPDLLTQLMKQHPGYEVIPDTAMHEALTAHDAANPACRILDSCRRTIARELHADLVVSGSIARRGRTLALYLALTRIDGSSAVERTSEWVASKQGLPVALNTALQHLFHWTKLDIPTVPPPPSARSAIATEAIPPINDAAFAEPPARKRIAILDLHASGVPGAALTTLQDLIDEAVAAQALLERIPDQEGRDALRGRTATDAACNDHDPCRARVGQDVKADEVLAGSFLRSGRGYELKLSLVFPDAPAQSRHAVRKMVSMDPLPGLLTECLEDLFQWSFGSLGKPGTGRASGPRRVMVMDLRAIQVEAANVAPLASLVASRIGVHPEYDVTSPDDVHQMLDAQKRKQATGCEQDDACLVEISRKLNADLVVSGSVGHVGSSYVITLTRLDPKQPGSNSSAQVNVDKVENLPRGAQECLDKLFQWGSATTKAFRLPPGKKLLFAVFDLRPTGLTPETAQNLTQALSTEVKGVEGASVVSRDDVAAMLQLEETKMKAGCDDAGCMAEIGGALGVDRLITGDAGKIGALYIVNLRLIDVRHGIVENRSTESYQGDEEELLHAVRVAVRSLLGLTATGKGHLAVTATQNPADVFVDGSKVELTPTKVDLGVGKHELRVAERGYLDWHSDVYVDSTETTSVWAQLSAVPTPWFQKWWVWSSAGFVVVAAGVLGGVLPVVLKPKTTGTASAVIQ